jgi:D-inositol-3-phosphate glycosyltransferase
MGPSELGDDRPLVQMENRIALVAPCPRARGGVAQFSANLARALGEGRELLYVCFRRMYPAWSRPARRGGPDPSRPRVEIDATPVLVPWLPWTWVRAARQIERFRPGLVVAQWWHPLFGPCLGYLARRVRRAGVPVAFVCHNARPHEGFPGWRSLTRRALRHADRAFALSEHVAGELREIVPDTPVRVLGHPPNLEPEPAARTTAGDRTPWRERIGPVEGPVVLFFGYVRPYKGLHDLIAAMPQLRARVPATLVVAGPFLEAPERFRRQADALGLGDAVRLFPSYVPDEEVADLFAAADVLALPYRSASQSGVIPLAAAFGVPVVATAVGDIPETLDGQGVVVPARDPGALASGLARALREPTPAPRRVAADWNRWALELSGLARSTPQPAGRRHPALVAAGKTAGWALVAYFVARVFLDGIRGLHGTTLRFAWWPLVVSCLLLVLERVTDVASWYILVRGTGSRVPLRTAARIYTTAQLVRFLPGGALHLAARYRFAAKVGVPAPAIVTATALDLGLRIVLALVLFLVSLPFWPTAPVATVLLAALTIPAFVGILHPRVLGWVLARVSRLLRRKWEVVPMPYPVLIRAGGFVAAGWVLRGVAAYLVTRSLVDIRPGLLMPVAGATAVAWALGVVTPFAPGGLGVREATAASLMSRFLTLSTAIVVVLVARVQTMIIELGTTAAVVAWDRVAGRQATGSRQGERATEPGSDSAPVMTMSEGRL